MLATYRPILDVFPKIQHLEWSDDDRELLAFAHLFITGGLRSLKLRYTGDEGYERLTSVINSAVHRRCPLREFRLHLRYDDYVEEVEQAVTGLIHATNLEIYDSNANIRANTVQRLLHSRTTRILKFPSAQVPCDAASLNACQLAAVEVLHIGVSSIQSCIPIILQIAPHTLTDLAVTRKSDPTRESAYSFFQALSKRTDPGRMKKLTLLPHEALYGIVNRQYSLSPERFSLNGVLEPLYALSNLTHLHITTIYLVVTDNLINVFTRQFRRLESLLLLPGYYCRRPLRATLNSIRKAAIELPGLRVLGYPVDTSVEVSPVTEYQAQFNSTCSFLDFADSLLSEDMVDKVAIFLSSFLGHPDLQITAFDHDKSGDRRYLHDIGSLRQRRAWRMVRKAMRLDKTAVDELV